MEQRTEEAFYHQVFDAFCAGDDAEFVPSSCYTFSREKGQMIDEYVVNYEELTLTPKGRYLMVAMMRQFFIGVNGLRDQARASLPGDEHALIFGR